jgi:methylmalonyl-CoA mutase N-terminal domain/subunit
VETKEQVVVGLNDYVTRREKIHFRLYYPPKTIEKAQKEKLRRLRKERSSQKVKKTLDALKRAAESGQNLMPRLIAAVEAEATLGEISDTLRAVYGTFQDTTLI